MKNKEFDTWEIFIDKIKKELQFEDIDILPETNFRELKQFSSVHALLLYNFILQEYGVELTIEEFTEAQKVLDIYEIIKNKYLKSKQND